MCVRACARAFTTRVQICDLPQEIIPNKITKALLSFNALLKKPRERERDPG